MNRMKFQYQAIQVSTNLPAANTSEMMGDDAVLPAPDPFDESGVSGNIDPTDDLLNLFEQTSRSQIFVRLQRDYFHPPLYHCT